MSDYLLSSEDFVLLLIAFKLHFNTWKYFKTVHTSIYVEENYEQLHFSY